MERATRFDVARDLLTNAGFFFEKKKTFIGVVVDDLLRDYRFRPLEHDRLRTRLFCKKKKQKTDGDNSSSSKSKNNEEEEEEFDFEEELEQVGKSLKSSVVVVVVAILLLFLTIT